MSEVNKLTIGGRVKMVRGDMKLIEFAQFIGIGKSSISRYENNQGSPDAVFITALYEKCGVEPLWLLTGKGESGMQLSPREATLIHNYRAIPNEEGKRYVEQSAQITAKADKDETKPRMEKKKVG
ncbi:MAG: helix-turn-helix domain-containing protein [Thiomicrospira sp.]|jgi:transcriptional regulator with XRE-family HTH domain